MLHFKHLPILVFACCFAQQGLAQHADSTVKAHKFQPFHSVGLAIGHAHSFRGVDENGSRKNMVLPFFGFDYNYQFSPRWALGLHTDLINETFVVEKHNSTEELERSRPIAPALMAMYSPTHRWKLGVGVGGEFAKEGSY
jgi:hypothetical protein